ncbi:MAG: hypothetical protein KAU26_10835 [Methylococcales bacterium]|nr:hypothetical protein [Methylococcales bacterium]
MAEKQAKVSIDDVEYIYDDLSDEAKAQIQSIQFADNEIARLNAQLAVANTAKIAYQNALKDVLAR